MENQAPPRTVASLTGPRLPADRGLAGLGLLMQLVGGCVAAVMAMVAMTPLLGGASPIAWPLFLLGASGAIRAIYHRAAGGALIYGSSSGHQVAVRRYLLVAVAETAIWAYVMKAQLGVPTPALVGLAAVSLAWPVALAAALATPALR